MDRNIIKTITTASTELLKRLVTECHWVMAHLNTKQGQEDARKENPNKLCGNRYHRVV